MTFNRFVAATLFLATSGISSAAETPIEHGAYIAAIAGCIECHTARKPGAPILSGGTEFGKGPGAAISANITPDRETGIGTWSEFADRDSDPRRSATRRDADRRPHAPARLSWIDAGRSRRACRLSQKRTGRAP